MDQVIISVCIEVRKTRHDMKTAEEILKKYVDPATSPIGDYIKAMEEYASLIASEKESKWVSVKERLPEGKRQRVIFFGRGKDVHAEQPNAAFVGIYHDGDDEWYSLGQVFVNVTHWMALPLAPKQ